jgi:hypothetical protein
MGPEATTMRTRRRIRRPAAIWLVVALLAFLAIGGFIGGVAFVTDPTGASIGAQLTWLAETPVSDFLLPGLFLLVVFAIGSVALIAGLLWRPAPGVLGRIDATWHHHWAWVGTIAMGATLVAWIVYELTIFSERMVLQPILFVVGIAMAALCAVPSIRRYYAVPPRLGGDER